jgi:hypothetical protein
MGHFASGGPSTEEERKALCRWLLDAHAEGDLINPDSWHLQRSMIQYDRIEFEFVHTEGHEVKMAMPMVEGRNLIEAASYNVNIVRRGFDMNTGEVTVTRNTYSDNGSRSYKVEPKNASYKSADPEWGAW